MKQRVDKLAVFDLDDTLYVGNSHFALLNKYFRTSFFSSILMRALGKYLPSLRMKICNYSYQRIPKNIRQNFTLPCRPEVVSILKKKQSQGFKVIIVSNAPDDLLIAAESKFHVPVLRADFGCKSKVVRCDYDYGELFVCTDNKTDLDLLYLANEAVLTCRAKDQSFFEKNLVGVNYRFVIERRMIFDE